MMIAGAAAGMAGAALPMMEMGNALSVLLIGAAIALSWDNRPAAGADEETANAGRERSATSVNVRGEKVTAAPVFLCWTCDPHQNPLAFVLLL